MNATTQTVENGSDDARRIGQDRLERAITQDMQIDATLPQQFAVTHDGRTFDVDVEQGTCQCEDHTYRGDSVVCKHVLAACVYGVFTDGVRTRLQARIVSAAREQGCPHDHSSIHGGACDGPLGRGVFPCPECVAATPGSWSAWKFLVEDEHVTPDTSADAGSQEPVAVTDGGTEADGGTDTTMTDGDEDVDAYACPWDNCRETFPRTGSGNEDAALLTSHAYAVHHGHIANPEACAMEDAR